MESKLSEGTVDILRTIAKDDNYIEALKEYFIDDNFILEATRSVNLPKEEYVTRCLASVAAQDIIKQQINGLVNEYGNKDKKVSEESSE